MWCIHLEKSFSDGAWIWRTFNEEGKQIGYGRREKRDDAYHDAAIAFDKANEPIED